MPVLKSNAYGHSLVEVAQILDKEEKAFFVVDSLYEAMILRNKGVKSPLLIIGYTSPNNINTCKLSRVMFTVTSWDNTIKIFKSNFKNIKYFHVSAYVSRTKYLAFKQKIR